MEAASSSVPCGGCTLCCKKQRVWLTPADDAAGLRVKLDTNAQLGRAMLRLENKPNGDCVYLGDGGCTIYERRPRVCRLFDCREHYHKPAAVRRILESMMDEHDLSICRRGRQIVESSR